MTETTVYIVCGIIGYLVAYMAVIGAAAAIWILWARRKLGPFWEYSVECSMELYYPGWYRFTIYHRKLYFALYVLIWPIMAPVAFTMMTKAANLWAREYCY